MGQRFHVDNYYLVQVKSTREDILYDGKEAVRWLLSHRYPFFIAHVDKKEGRVAVFQTLKVTMCYAKAGIERIALRLQGGASFAQIAPEKNLAIELGPPILDFEIGKLADAAFVQTARDVMRTWVTYDQFNLDLKGAGLTVFQVPTSYSTNYVPGPNERTIGNFKDASTSPLREKYYDVMFRLLANHVNLTAARGDKERFKRVADFVGQTLREERLGWSIGLGMLAVAVNCGARHVGYEAEITLADGNGNKLPLPQVRIEG